MRSRSDDSPGLRRQRSMAAGAVALARLRHRENLDCASSLRVSTQPWESIVSYRLAHPKSRSFRRFGLAMSEANIVLPTLTSGEVTILWLVLLSAVVALGYGLILIRTVLAADPGPKSMTDVSDAVEQGAMAYLFRQIRTMIWFVIAIFVVLFLMYRNVYQGLSLPLGIAVAFLLGVSASYGAGYVGMWLAVKGNVRSANAALTSFK